MEKFADSQRVNGQYDNLKSDDPENLPLKNENLSSLKTPHLNFIHSIPTWRMCHSIQVSVKVIFCIFILKYYYIGRQVAD